MPTPAEVYRQSLSSGDQNAWQESLNMGSNNNDIYNWFQAKQANPDAIASAQAAFNADPANQYGPGKLSLLAQYIDPNFRGVGLAFGDDSEEGNAKMKIALQQAKSIDPNAHFDNQGVLQLDRSKLPAFVGGNQNAQYINKGLSNLIIDSGQKRVQDPTKVIHDPNYGNYTAANNLSVSPGDSNSGFMGQLGKYMPYVTSAIMSAGMGAAAGPLMGAALSGTLGPGGIGNRLAMNEPINWGNVAKNVGMSAAGSLIPGAMGGAMQGLTGSMPSYMGDLLKYLGYAQKGYGIYNQVKGHG
jgi:hypothetical protein